MVTSKAKLAQAELALAYTGGLGLTVIRVLIGKTSETPCWLQVEHQPDLIEADGPLVIFDTLWFPKASHADLVHQQILTVLGVEPDVAISLAAAAVRDALVNEAGNLGASWQSTQEVVAAAEMAVEEIERHMKVLNEVGGLSNFNKACKQYRLRCIDTAMPAVPYSAHLHTLKLKVARLVGENTGAGIESFSGFSAIIPSSSAAVNKASADLLTLRNTATPFDDRLEYPPLHHTRKRVHQMRRLKA